MKDLKHIWYILGKSGFQVRLFHKFQTRQRKKIVSIESAKFGTFFSREIIKQFEDYKNKSVFKNSPHNRKNVACTIYRFV